MIVFFYGTTFSSPSTPLVAASPSHTPRENHPPANSITMWEFEWGSLSDPYTSNSTSAWNERGDMYMCVYLHHKNVPHSATRGKFLDFSLFQISFEVLRCVGEQYKHVDSTCCFHTSEERRGTTCSCASCFPPYLSLATCRYIKSEIPVNNHHRKPQTAPELVRENDHEDLDHCRENNLGNTSKFSHSGKINTHNQTENNQPPPKTFHPNSSYIFTAINSESAKKHYYYGILRIFSVTKPMTPSYQAPWSTPNHRY